MELFEEYYYDNYSDFNEWFAILKNNEKCYPYVRIPYEEWLDDYIKNIHNINDNDVTDLLRILLRPFTREIDIFNIEAYEELYYLMEDEKDSEKCTKEEKETIKRIYNSEHFKRMTMGHYAWEGFSWILNLLPSKPLEAIRALNSYMSAEVCCMPDDRIIGIDQCIDIIEAKYIKNTSNKEVELLKLKPREFERLIEVLYQHFGYDTILTKATRDGGKDIIATIERETGKEKIYIECKLYKTTKLKKETVMALYGVISQDNISRGVMYCTRYVNNCIRETNERIQIISLDEIIILLNSYVGTNWDELLPNLLRD